MKEGGKGRTERERKGGGAVSGLGSREIERRRKEKKVSIRKER